MYHVLKPPPIARSILKRERDGKFEKAVNLEKPSLAMTMHFKIECSLNFLQSYQHLLPMKITQNS
jgi:hypothetical protein